MTFSPPRVLLFDVMGTVVDYDGCLSRETTEVLTAAGVAADDVVRVLEKSSARLDALLVDASAGHRPWQSHRLLRVTAVSETLAALGLPPLDPAAEASIAAITDRLPGWPESAAALERLRGSFVIVALSNADVAELAAMSAHSGLSWHAVLSAEQVAAFKPDPRMYRHALRTFDLPAERVLMVAAHPWDLRAAAEHGLATAFIDQPGAEQPAAEDRFDLAASDLADLADQLGVPPAG